MGGDAERKQNEIIIVVMLFYFVFVRGCFLACVFFTSERKLLYAPARERTRATANPKCVYFAHLLKQSFNRHTDSLVQYSFTCCMPNTKTVAYQLVVVTLLRGFKHAYTNH